MATSWCRLWVHLRPADIQSDGVTISKVYPCINFLKKKLILNLELCEYTKKIREELLISLNDRFVGID